MPDTHAGTHGRSGATRSQIPSGEERGPVSYSDQILLSERFVEPGLTGFRVGRVLTHARTPT